MQNTYWDKPVRAGGCLILGPLEAHRFLMHEWPSRKNQDWCEAESSMLAALDGRTTTDEARERFEAALKSAQLS
jgi:hypothetical protein